MIVGQDFAWLHFMKTGGHAVELALRAALRGRRDVRFDERKPPYLGWHHSAAQRELDDPHFSAADKTIICGFRRLPMWLLSRVHYEASKPPHRHVTREMLCTGQYFENAGDLRLADTYLRDYISPPVDRWIRHEHLAQDFAAAFGDLLQKQLPRALRRLGMSVNATPMPYIKDPAFYFTAKELRGLYDANPRWAALEEQLYGDLIRVG
jgi:hypothetical protein